MKKRSLFLGIQVSLFLFILFYLTQLNPLLPYDGDDWRYVGGVRLPFPIWGAWNPTRVLPEVLMPLGGTIAAFVIYPISKDYVASLAFTEALIETVFIFTVLYLFYRLLVKRELLSKWSAVACEIGFFFSFFLLFKKFDRPSYTGFWAGDLSCVFYYIIPGLINLALVLYMLQTHDFNETFNEFTNLRKGLFLLVLYFAIFSNTQLNIIIATFSFVKIIEVYFLKIKKGKKIILKSIWLYCLIMILWLLTVIFDLRGERAKDVATANQGTFLQNLGLTLNKFIELFRNQNKYIFILFVLLIIIAVILSAVRGKNSNYQFLLIILNVLFCCVLSFIYLVLAYTKAGSLYASRPDSMWAVISLFIFAANLSFAYFVKEYSNLKVIMPFLLVIIGIISFNMNERPVYAWNTNHDPLTIKNVDNYIINQIVSADRKGESEVVVTVPLDSKDASPKETTSNWPHSYDMAVWMQNTLYSHRITRTRMHIIFKPDSKVNTKFYENASDQQLFIPPE